MFTTSKQTTPATITQKMTGKDDSEIKESVSFLSQTKKEIDISKLSCPNDKSNTSEPNKARLKMKMRLEPIAILLALLPKPLSKQTSKFPSSLLFQAIKVRHYKRKVNYHNSNPDVFSLPIRFKFKLSYKSKYEAAHTFKTQALISSKIMDNCKDPNVKL